MMDRPLNFSILLEISPYPCALFACNDWSIFSSFSLSKNDIILPVFCMIRIRFWESTFVLYRLALFAKKIVKQVSFF